MIKVTQTFTFAALATVAFAGVAAAQDAAQQPDTTTTTTQMVTTETSVQGSTLVATHTVKTIAESPKSGAHVTLIGTIGAKVAKDTYVFTDRTGSIRAEISNKKMPADLTLGQQVQIDGTIHTSKLMKRDFLIDVDTVRLI